jgi:hypothetical protein
VEGIEFRAEKVEHAADIHRNDAVHGGDHILPAIPVCTV